MSQRANAAHNQALRLLQKSSYKGVRGVLCIDSGKSGPTIGITVCTHGNEPVGLSVVNHLFSRMHIGKKLLYGKLLLVLNNMKAAEKSARFVDTDMNRLPPGVMRRKKRLLYEHARAQKLYPVWQEFDIALDIHTTSQNAPPMIITVGGTRHSDLIKGFPIARILTDIDRVQIGKPASAFYGRAQRCRTAGIEAGQHTAAESRRVAIRCVEALLANSGVVQLGKRIALSNSFEEYRIFQSIVFPDDSYEMVKIFTNFKPVKAGRVLARGNGPDIVMPRDGCMIFQGKNVKPTDIKSEVVFLTERKQRIVL